MTTERYHELEQEFKVIRDERGVAQNTAVRIGTAFLDLLRYCMSGEFDEITFNKVLNKPTFMKGLITLGSIVLGEYAEGLQGGIITEEGVAELKDLWVRQHAKIGDGSIHRDEAGRVLPALEVKGDSTFTGNLSSPEFVSDFLGGLGWAIQKKEFVNSAGVIEYKYTLEIDNAVIRNTLRVFEMIISQLLGENDNRIFAAMMEVHHYDPETGKVWLSTNNGRWFMNFRKDDCIMVQQYQAENDVVSGGDGYITKSYELLITDVGSGGETDENGDRLDWVTFTNFATQMADNDGKPYTPEMLIKEGDTFTRVDNLTDPDRKGIVTMMTVGNNTPYMDVRYGLKTDPKNNLKSRIGNLEGIRSDIFGWLEGFGIYTTNYYGIGHFINAQTGENVQARQEMTLERFHSFYQETTYNISDEDNFLTNGFFQKELESWQRCEADGTPVADEPESMLLGTVEESGEAMMPLMINGQMLSVANRRVADITDLDGIKVLHLLGMGVSQAFSDIKPKGTHKEMESDSQESTEVVDVDDFMYMGIRILPVTHGTLYAKFIKADGSWTGWETELEDSFDWVLWQDREIEASRGEWAGSGTFVLWYSGECYIRFVALTTDAVANARVDYQTHIEQTSRRITLQAIKTDAQHQTAMAEIQLQHDAVMDVVTTNKSTSDTMLSTILGITVNPDGTYNIPDALKGENMATWRINTNSHIIDLAAHWDENDQLIGYSTSQQTADAISSAVYGLAKSSEVTALNESLTLKINSDIGTVNETIQSVNKENDDRAAVLATWQEQTDARITAIAGKWDSNGNLIGYSTSQQTADAISAAVVNLASKASVESVQNSINTLNNTTIPGLISDISVAHGLAQKAKDTADAAYSYGTLINQHSDSISVLSNRFNADGSLKNTSGLVTGNGDFATLFSSALRSDGTVMKKADMGTYVQKDGDGYITGAFIDADRIDFQANLVQVKNQDGDITFQLDEDGNLKVMGTIDGGKVIDDIKVGSKGHKMEIYCDERSSSAFSYHSGIRGWDNSGNKVIDLGFIEYGTDKLRASLNFGDSYYRGSEFSISNGTYKLDVGFGRNDKISIFANYSAWPVGDPATLGCSKGELYVDNDGYVKIYNK